jgi:hypothetical protein
MQRFSMIATDIIHGILDLSAMPGERVNATAVQASVLLRKKLARFATAADDVHPEPEPIPEPVIAPEPEAEPRPRRRRRSNSYKTRDMAAEA